MKTTNYYRYDDRNYESIESLVGKEVIGSIIESRRDRHYNDDWYEINDRVYGKRYSDYE